MGNCKIKLLQTQNLKKQQRENNKKKIEKFSKTTVFPAFWRGQLLTPPISKQHVPPDFYDNMNFDVFSNLYNEGKKTYISRF